MKALRWLDKNAELTFVAAGIAFIAVVMGLQIVCRTFLGFSVPWAEESCRHMFMCICIMGIPYQLRTNAAIKFDMILTYLPKKAVTIITMISYVIMLAFFIRMLQPALSVVLDHKTTYATTMPYSMSMIFGVCWMGIVLAVFRLAEMIIIYARELMQGGGQRGEGK